MAEAEKKKSDFDPEDYRMTIGEHLEELRRRLMFGIIGFGLAVIVCMLFGERIILLFCRPLYLSLLKRGINPQLYYTGISDAFMTYLKISLYSALFFAGPWIIYQLWKFVAAGLYSKERKVITRYIPLSISLLLAGMLFVYFLVLPMTIGILIDFGSSLPMPVSEGQKVSASAAATQPTRIEELKGDPEKPFDRQIWLNSVDGRLKLFWRGKVKVVPFGPENLAAPMITLPDYIDLVVLTMVTFGLCFQLPLVVMAIARIGIVDIATLKKSRRLVYFIMSILAAVVAPGDVVTAMMALLVPLILLYEMGIWLGARAIRRAAEAAKAEEAAEAAEKK